MKLRDRGYVFTLVAGFVNPGDVLAMFVRVTPAVVNVAKLKEDPTKLFEPYIAGRGPTI